MNKKYKEYATKQEVIDNKSQQSQAIETHFSLSSVDVFHHLFVHVVSNLIC